MTDAIIVSVPQPRLGTDELDDDLRKQAKFLTDRVPEYSKILETVRSFIGSSDAARTAVIERLDDAWREREFFAWYERPLLLLACVRAEALRQGLTHPLFAVIGEKSTERHAVTANSVLTAFDAGRARFWRDVRERRVQTNETSRAIAWMWPAYLAGCDAGRRPLVLVDIGASAGLNLVADRLPSMWTSDDGAPLPIAGRVHALRRIGIDSRPVDLADDDAVTWLRACVWPTDGERLARLDAAVAAMQRARSEGCAPELVAMDVRKAPDLLRRLLAETSNDTFVLAYQTVMREYLPPDVLHEYTTRMQAVLAESGAGRAAWIELETGPAVLNAPPAALYAHASDREAGFMTLTLARCFYHPTVIQIDRPSVERFVRATFSRSEHTN